MQTVVRRNECVVHSAIVQFGEDMQIRHEKGNNLRDQLVYGCHDDSLREIFREETLTLQTARQISTAHEAARQNMNLFRGQQQTHDSAAVNRVMKVKADKSVSPRWGSTEVRRLVPGQVKCTLPKCFEVRDTKTLSRLSVSDSDRCVQ